MNELCLVISGCPGSGKTLVGRAIAKELNLPLLDKDDYLEDLYEKRGIGDAKFRTQLSLESNELFEKDATALNRVILVSHWRPRNESGLSGTPTEWLKKTYNNIIEIYCSCPANIAAQRFVGRRRHKGHLDASRSDTEIYTWLAAYSEALPLGIGKVVELDTSTNLDVQALMNSIKAASNIKKNQV